MGAQSSGKSWLFRALTRALQAEGVQHHWVISESPAPNAPASLQAITLLMGLDGQGVDRLSNALMALGLACDTVTTGLDRESAQFNINRGRDVWQCNDCSDPSCEHKLFTGLLAKRAG